MSVGLNLVGGEGFLALVRRRLLQKREAVPEDNQPTQVMRNINGSESTVNEKGQTVKFRDAEGRLWSFMYQRDQIIAFSDPLGGKWSLIDGIWTAQPSDYRETAAGSCKAPLAVEVNQHTGDVTLVEPDKTTIYRADGSTVSEREEVIEKQLRRCITVEYPTRPHHSFVRIEVDSAGRELVTSIQDANRKTYHFEYDGTTLIKFIDAGAEAEVVWTACHDPGGNVIGWTGYKQGCAEELSSMIPCLIGLDSNGNRHYKTSENVTFVVRPSGAAYHPSSTYTKLGTISGAMRKSFSPF